MLLSFPIGAYVVFNSGIEKDINFDYPIEGFDIFPAGIGFEVPLEFELGDGFIIAWIIFIILFIQTICNKLVQHLYLKSFFSTSQFVV